MHASTSLLDRWREKLSHKGDSATSTVFTDSYGRLGHHRVLVVATGALRRRLGRHRQCWAVLSCDETLGTSIVHNRFQG